MVALIKLAVVVEQGWFNEGCGILVDAANLLSWSIF